MGSSVVVPDRERLANYPPAIADALITGLTQAKADLDGLTGGTLGSDGIRCRFATTANINLATTGLTAIDGVTPVAGDIALVKNQSTPSQNGFYTVSAGAWVRLTSTDGSSLLKEGVVGQVAEGTAAADTLWMLASDGTTWNEVEAGTATPAPIAAAGAVGTSALFAHSDHTHADPNRAAAGAALTDAATQTIQPAAGYWRTIGTLSQGGTLTLGVTGAVAGDQWTITRTGTDAFTYAIVNGGAGAGTLATMPVSKKNALVAQFDGTNWALRQIGTQ